MKWTTPFDLKVQMQKLWDRGLLLVSIVNEEPLFPYCLKLKRPNSRELSECFSEVRDWITQLHAHDKYYRIESREINHRVLGANKIPDKISVDTLDDALAWIGKRHAAEQFSELVNVTRLKFPELLAWLAKRPLRVLELASDWTQLLEIVSWMRDHPRPAIYLRQVDSAGVHTKMIEGHRGVLAELFDLVLSPESIDQTSTGVAGFCRRYGFLDKPLQVRFRILDPDKCILPVDSDVDITLTQPVFSRLEWPVSKVFITENEINFLAFPNVLDAMVIFGAGYGFENIKDASWLQRKEIFYWGDIDTHGFAILNQLRRYFPSVTSLLMNQEVLLAHRFFWGTEPQPETANLQRLNAEEEMLYNQLRKNYWSDCVRLEQEKIGFDFLIDVLQLL